MKLQTKNTLNLINNKINDTKAKEEVQNAISKSKRPSFTLSRVFL